MSLTPSTMLSLGTPAPKFSLPDTDGKWVSLDDFKNNKALLVMFICNHCPYVKHVQKELASLCKEYQAKGVGVVAINSNDIQTHPEDSPENMALEKSAAGYTFPYLFDETQSVAKQYQAACTPDFYVFDAERKLVYRGQMDDSRPKGNRPNNGADLRAALDSVLIDRPVPSEQRPSMGCNIKWREGNEPAYYR